MPSQTGNRILKSAFALVASLISLVGLIFFIAALQTYVSGDTSDAVPFTQITFALTCFCLPMAVYFTYRARKSFRFLRSEYEIPETPGRSTFFLVLSSGFSLATVVFLLLCLIVILFST
jgi:hypothetical protein